MKLHPAIKTELDNLQLLYGMQAYLDLDDYSVLYKIKRRDAAQHLKRKGIPYSKEGREIYISMLDLAAYKAQRKHGGLTLMVKPEQLDMNRRRGFAKMHEERHLVVR